MWWELKAYWQSTSKDHRDAPNCPDPRSSTNATTKFILTCSDGCSAPPPIVPSVPGIVPDSTFVHRRLQLRRGSTRKVSRTPIVPNSLVPLEPNGPYDAQRLLQQRCGSIPRIYHRFTSILLPFASLFSFGPRPSLHRALRSSVTRTTRSLRILV
jgi:hypothetical protein